MLSRCWSFSQKDLRMQKRLIGEACLRRIHYGDSEAVNTYMYWNLYLEAVVVITSACLIESVTTSACLIDSMITWACSVDVVISSASSVRHLLNWSYSPQVVDLAPRL